MSNPREVLEKYRINSDEVTEIKTIGHGSYGVIRLALYKDKKVALKKMLKRDPYGSSDNLGNDSFAIEEIIKHSKYFRAENIMMQTIAENPPENKEKHPNIVKYLGYIDGPNNIPSAIVMEYLPKDSLKYYITKEIFDFPLPACHHMMIDIASALKFLHEHVKLVHHDIKSGNVLLTKNNHAKLCDFGFTNFVDGNFDTRGTAFNMAPEVLLSTAPYQFSADIYSAGIVFHEIVTRKSCYHDKDFENLTTFKEYIKSGQQQTIPTYCPAPIKEAILATWKQDPKERPTAAQLLKMLRKKETAPKITGEKITITVSDVSNKEGETPKKVLG